MIPISISEQLLYSTIKIEALNGSKGTGFFYELKFDEKTVTIIVTNKHVLNNDMNTNVTFSLHLGNEDGPTNESVKVIYRNGWIKHNKHDLCFCFSVPIFEQIKKQYGKVVFYKAVEESMIYNDEDLSKLCAVEDVLMIGYPIGLSDAKNNFPLFRKGITATHPAIRFNNQDIGVVDIACFPGSSGSPILILNEGMYYDKNGTVNIGSRAIFLGVLYGGPVHDEEGRIVIKDIPTSQVSSVFTSQMINLGYYIQSQQLLEFRQTIKDIANL